MRYKVSLLISTIIFIFILYQIPTIVAIEYNAGVKEGEVFIWSCVICDTKKMEDVFGIDWNGESTGIFESLKQGARMKWSIIRFNDNDQLYSQKTENTEKAVSITINVWIWTAESNWGEKDYQDQLILFLNPANNLDNVIYPNFVPFWLPVPIGDYMKELEPYLYEGYTVDGRVLLAITCEVNKGNLDGVFPTEYIKVLAMYNEKGVLRSYKMYVSDHQVIIDISLVSNPILEIPIILTILIASYIGLVYVIRKID